MAEYRAMFALTDAHLTSVDPAYDRDPDELAAHAREEALRGNRFVATHLDRYVFTWFRSPAEHRELRLEGGARFAADLRLNPERYVAARLPHLPFADRTFELTLSSHLLFTYADRLDFAFHLSALDELARVTRWEVRAFPLVDLGPRRYPRLDELMAALERRGVRAEVRAVGYEFQRGGNEMLVLRRGAPSAAGRGDAG
jgi:hypothetical protein